MLESILTFLVQHWIAALSIAAVAYLARNRFNHGLNKYPGPFLASLTDWWRFFDVYGRRPDITQRRLHDQHGDIVRLGPNVLSFADPSALKTIYGLNKGFTKVRIDPWSLITQLMMQSQNSILFNKPFLAANAYHHSSLPRTRPTMHNFGGP
jgi:hypothetical protein